MNFTVEREDIGFDLQQLGLGIKGNIAVEFMTKNERQAVQDAAPFLIFLFVLNFQELCESHYQAAERR